MNRPANSNDGNPLARLNYPETNFVIAHCGYL